MTTPRDKTAFLARTYNAAMKRSGHADLPLHGGRVPQWLAQRMSALGGAISETIILDYGHDELLARLADPFWFQAFGCVLGMDWHSSGITTSVIGALKRALAPKAAELGIFVCGGRGRHSRQTPIELAAVGERTGLNATELIRVSRLSARVDNNAVGDGFQLYLHSFIVASDGQWVVVQQGMNDQTGMARRYHWHSAALKSFVEAPHSGIAGQPQGQIMNLVDSQAIPAQGAILEVLRQNPESNLREIRKLVMDRHHEVGRHCVDLKRLGAVLLVAYERNLSDFASALLMEKLGPRTLQSLALSTEHRRGFATLPGSLSPTAVKTGTHFRYQRRSMTEPSRSYKLRLRRQNSVTRNAAKGSHAYIASSRRWNTRCSPRPTLKDWLLTSTGLARRWAGAASSDRRFRRDAAANKCGCSSSSDFLRPQ
jgi:uncharacterized protein